MFNFFKWIQANLATIIGIVQGILKLIKELLTGIVNLFSIIIPTPVWVQTVKAVRDFVNSIDSLIEKIKAALLK